MDFKAERLSGSGFDVAQDLGRDFLRADDSAAGQLQPRGLPLALDDLVWQLIRILAHIRERSAHQAFGAGDGLAREFDRALARLAPDDDRAIVVVPHSRGDERIVFDAQNPRASLIEHRDQAVGRSKINSDDHITRSRHTGP